MTEFDTLLDDLCDVAAAAGRTIMRVYQEDFDIDDKADGSPVTTADRLAHELILQHLSRITPEIPVLSEESAEEAAGGRRGWSRFWLVDPLDGTKEFINRNGEFTVNIALVDDGEAVLGVVHTPAMEVTHFAARGCGAHRRDAAGTRSIRTRPFDPARVCLVASRSHAGEAVTAYRQALQQAVGEVESRSMGSALKICLVAEAEADVYPRLGPTSEWDTAASHCVLKEAGGALLDTLGNELTYNRRETLLNPHFLAIGDSGHDWLQYLPESYRD